jgi:SIR2-like domain
MQFTLNGPDIPQELITAQERGGVIFVCGAGTSMTVGLPSFKDLVIAVYEELGENWNGHTAESQIMSENTPLSGQYDRILRLLEKRLAASDIRQARGIRQRIRRAIDNNLRAIPGADLSNQLALLELSCGSDNIPRLLTTNFDTLFEWSWKDLKGGTINSHAGAAMPRPGTSGFEGVLHLHGRIGDSELKLEETDLVLTSAEFGEAYLRSGWAARYVYDLARTASLVLVGYRADDPPMRYLLEVLEADRARYPDLRPVYAFAGTAPDDIEQEQELWQAKGIEPLLYKPDAGGRHIALYDTLRSWHQYAAAPSRWRQTRLAEIVARPPKDRSAAEIQEAISLLNVANATVPIVNVSPSAAWWSILSEKITSADRGNALACWIRKRLDDPEMLQACLINPPTDSYVFEYLKTQLDFLRTNTPALYIKAWQLFVSSKTSSTSRRPSTRWHVVVGEIRAGKIDLSLREAAIDAVYPRLHVGQSFAPPDPGTEPTRLRQLVQVNFSTDEYVSARDILTAWPTDLEEEKKFFRLADRALTQALDEAEDAGYLSGVDLASHDTKSFHGTPPFDIEAGFAPLTRLVLGLWERIASQDPVAARSLAESWRATPYLLHRRFYIHALTQENVYDRDKIAVVLDGIDDEDFWISDCAQEVTFLLSSRWNDLDSAGRERLEERILKGPPRTLARTDIAISDDDWRATSDYYTCKVLNGIKNAGGILSQETSDRLAATEALYPTGALQPSPPASPLPGTAFAGPRGDVGLFSEVPDDKLLSEALEAQQRDFVHAGDTWRLVCEADPRRAIRAITSSVAPEHWTANILIPLLNANTESEDVDLEAELLAFLAGIPAAAMTSDFLRNAAIWIRRRVEKRPDPAPSAEMLRFWDRVVASAELHVETTQLGGDTTLEDAVNSPLGLLTLALLEWVNKPPRSPETGFGSELSARLKRIATVSTDAGKQARTLLAREMSYLHNVEPALIEENLVPLLSWSHPEASSLWLARARAGDGPGRADLFNSLKPAFLEAIRRTPELPAAATGLARHLLFTVSRRRDSSDVEYNLTPQEVRSALTNAPSIFLNQAAWLLSTSFGKDDTDESTRSNIWTTSIGPLFRAIWPLDASSLGTDISKKLIWMAIETGDAFPDAVEAVSDFIVPHDLISIHSSLMHSQRREVLAKKYPRAFIHLLDKTINESCVPHDIGVILDDWLALDPSLATDRHFLRLSGLRRLSES